MPLMMMVVMMMRSRAYKNLPTPSARAQVFGPKRCGAGVSVSVSVSVSVLYLYLCLRKGSTRTDTDTDDDQGLSLSSGWFASPPSSSSSACRAFLRTREEGSTQEQTSFRAVVATSDYTLNVVVS